MPTRTTRSGRVVKSASAAQAKLDALELLARQRRGEKVDIGVKEDEPLFEEVVEEDYKRTKKGGFIVDRDSDDEDESDFDDFIDDEFDDEDDASKSRAKGKGKRKAKEIEHDPTQRSMKSFLGTSSSKNKSAISSKSESSSSSKQKVNEDDVLSQMLFDVPINRAASSAQKPLKIMGRKIPPATISPSVSRTPKTKSSFEPLNVKRPRVASPIPIPEPPPAADWEDSIEWEDNKIPVEPAKAELSVAQSLTVEDESLDDNLNEPKIDVVPLNDDLKSNLDFFDHKDGKKYTRMYWYDCCEDQIRNPGVVYFFGRIAVKNEGKTKRYVSCCTVVKNVTKTCYLLISENCTYEEALGEFTNITAKKLKLKNFTCQKVQKKYAFSSDANIPLVADYVRVDYPATQGPIPNSISGVTFKCALNSNQSPMEKLILDLKLRGPCWLKLVEPDAPSSQLTWTRIELVLESPTDLLVEEDIKDLTPPYFCVLSMSIRTYKNPNTHFNEIIAITGMVNASFNLDKCLKSTNKADGHFVIMAKPSSGNKDLKLPYDFTTAARSYTRTRFQLVDNERDLLTTFMEKFSNYDPDIVVGHDLMNFDYETLVMRMKYTKVGTWSKLGRFKRTELPSTKAAFRYMFSGRVMCDIRTSAMELIHARSYDLNELTLQVLKKTRRDLTHDNLIEAFKTSKGVISVLQATWEDNDNIFSILVELNVIPLALKITNITGNILSRTLAAGRSERNEYLLLHAFHEADFICPEKQILKHKNQKDGNGGDEVAPVRKKAAYSGGLVLEPKTGYYDDCILLMDFNSLYPSIIQEYNICFSTVAVPEKSGGADCEVVASLPDEGIATGILPTQLKNLVDRRRRVKRLMAEAKSPDEKLMLDIEQKALKLTANSMYGCLGFEYSRFYARHLASLVTFKGREILMSTKAMVEKLGYEVIYGDTDSLMINTKIIEYDEVIAQGTAIKGEINRAFKLLEIDIDGVFKPLLLLKKKNYAGVCIKKSPDGNISKTTEIKGLDTVRRDRAVIAKEAGEKVLSMVLSGEKDIDLVVEEVHNYLKQLGENIRSNLIPAEKFLISKQLNRNPEEYRDRKGIGHVTLALRHNMNAKNTRKMKAGDTVEYVVCLDGSTESANQRSYTLAEMDENLELELDKEYYLCQQIHPVMSRICEKLPVTNAYVLAEMLGVEKSSLLHIRRDESSDVVQRDQLLSKGEARFNTCEPMLITCPNCNLPDKISTRTRKNKKSNKVELSLTTCPECYYHYATKARLIVVQIIAAIKRLSLKLYNGKFICENSECNFETRNLFCTLTSDDISESSTNKIQPLCNMCENPMSAELDDRKMDLQLNFMRHLLDGVRERESNQQEVSEFREDVLEMYQMCHKELEYALRSSFINNIDGLSMFGMICSRRAPIHHDEKE